MGEKLEFLFRFGTQFNVSFLIYQSIKIGFNLSTKSE